MNVLLLDLDGTIIVDQGRNGRSAEAVKLLPGVTAGLRKFRDAGYAFFIVTNQGGIARGSYSLEDFLGVLRRTEELLKGEGIIITGAYYCPHHPDENCRCRKPKTGLWEDLIKDHPGAHAENGIFVGDKDGDMACGKAIGCRTARIRSAVYPMTLTADWTADTIDKLAGLILRPGKVLSIADAAALSESSRKKGMTVVTTNGSFDLLHAGHRFLLAEARKQGDVLLVGVNSDASVKRYKGKDRPIESQDIRAAKVARHADAVFIFDDDDPRAWLKTIRPDVHVNAETYGKDCIEAPVVQEIGAQLVLIPVRKELGSTTEILQKRSSSKP